MRYSVTNTSWGHVAAMHLGGNLELSIVRLALTAVLADVPHRLVVEAPLAAWMHAHLRVAVLALPPDAVSAGEQASRDHQPALNLRDVPHTRLSPHPPQ